MKRTYRLIVERSGHPGEHSYLVTIWNENHRFLMAHRASSLEDCMAAVTGRLISDDAGNNFPAFRRKVDKFSTKIESCGDGGA